VRITLVDYGAGNLTSVRKAFAASGVTLSTAAEPADLVDADGIVVPGVGNFAATAGLGDQWHDAVLRSAVRGIPLLGICLGLQWLFGGSDEAPGISGLDMIRGTCARLPSTVKVPHVGWNALRVLRPSRLLDGVPSGTQVYFTHSYAAPVTSECVATTDHGAPFAAAVERNNLMGVQFHPEKSGEAGLRIVRNFVASCSRSG
jgi:imidazole glycerol-phosphate synthase subunit HisH